MPRTSIPPNSPLPIRRSCPSLQWHWKTRPWVVWHCPCRICHPGRIARSALTQFPCAFLARAMREKADYEEKTFALTADVKEAHRQVPIAPEDWHLLACQVQQGSTVYLNTVGTFGVASASCYWSRVAAALGRLSQYLAHARSRRLSSGGWRTSVSSSVDCLLCSVCGMWCSLVLEQNCWG